MKTFAFVLFGLALYIFIAFLVLMLSFVQLASGETKISLLAGEQNARIVKIEYQLNRVEPFILSQIDSEAPWFGWGVGADYKLLNSSTAGFDIGIVWLAEMNKFNGTRLNSHFELTQRLTDGLNLSLSHISHGSKFGIEPGKPNHGWNLIGVTWKF